jgi:hypothetical protein
MCTCSGCGRTTYEDPWKAAPPPASDEPSEPLDFDGCAKGCAIIVGYLAIGVILLVFLIAIFTTPY